MIPLRDNIQARRRPIVNYALIGITSVVFLLQIAGAPELRLEERFSMIPRRVFEPEATIRVPTAVRVDPFRGQVIEYQRAAPPPFSPWLTLLTCIFLHGGWLHFLGNMWFLAIFGDNVEDRLGRIGYLVFYLGAGLAASVAHLLTNASSEIPTVGASGAIAGVMGGYLLLYPHAKVLTLVPIFPFFLDFILPAPLFLGVWFVLQFFQGVMSIGAVQSGGVAWWAHVGGFVAGFVVVWILRRTHVLRSRPGTVVPGTDRLVRRHRRGPGRF